MFFFTFISATYNILAMLPQSRLDAWLATVRIVVVYLALFPQALSCASFSGRIMHGLSEQVGMLHLRSDVSKE